MYLYLPMSKARVKGVKEGKVKGSVYKHNIGEPEESLRFNKAIANQYETPVLFYAVCLATYVSGNASGLIVILAWLYVIVKLCHIFVHTTSNRLQQRRPIFIVSFAILGLMWIAFAVQLAGLI